MSLIVCSENAVAKRLYEKSGLMALDSAPVVPYPGCNLGGEWILMVKELKA